MSRLNYWDAEVRVTSPVLPIISKSDDSFFYILFID